MAKRARRTRTVEVEVAKKGFQARLKVADKGGKEKTAGKSPARGKRKTRKRAGK